MTFFILVIILTDRLNLGDDIAQDVGRRGPRPAVPLLGVLVVGAATAASAANVVAVGLNLGRTGRSGWAARVGVGQPAGGRFLSAMRVSVQDVDILRQTDSLDSCRCCLM